VDKAWAEAGRPGRPRKLTLAYYGLGPEARSQAEGYILHYYGWLGETAGQSATFIDSRRTGDGAEGKRGTVEAACWGILVQAGLPAGAARSLRCRAAVSR